MTIGKCLRNARKSRAITQKELEEMTGVGQHRISDYERDIRIPLLDTAIIIADCLDMSMEECYTENTSQYVNKPLTHRHITDSMKQNRINRGLKACWVAKQIGVTNNTLYRMEGGISIPSLKTVMDASASMGLTIDEYIGRV